VLLAIRVRRIPEEALRWIHSAGGERVPRLWGAMAIAYVEEVYDLPLDVPGVHGLPTSVVSSDE
jgi:uncharacterized protein (DUF952 family)